MSNRLLLENNTDAILLEDASGVLILEGEPAPVVSLNNSQAVKVGDGMSTAADHRFKR